MSDRSSSTWRRAPGGVLLRVRLTPRASRDAVEGITETAEGPALAVRVRAVPEDNAANAALEAVLAKWFQYAKSDVTVAGGRKSRVKTVAISCDADDFEAKLSGYVAELAGTGTKSDGG